jgi:hypothetical protein
MKVRCVLPKKEKDMVGKVIHQLSSDYLLRKCLPGGTQNPNESIHSKLWAKLPKSKHAGLHTVQYMASQTVMEHNTGYSNTDVIESMGFSSRTDHSFNVKKFRDSERKRHAKEKKEKRLRNQQPPTRRRVAGLRC